MKVFPLFAFAVCAMAQNGFYLDLSGDWRTILGDDPAYSKPDFDDSHWQTIHLPLDKDDSAFNSVRWLRRDFAAPAGTPANDLVLTIGSFRLSYQVFVNGTLLDTALQQPAQIYPKPRMFLLPPALLRAGETNRVAIRALAAISMGALMPIPGAGPFLITSRANAPYWALEAERDRRLRRATPVIVAALLNEVFAALLILLWVGNREERVLLALGLFLAFESWNRWSEYLAVYLELPPNVWLAYLSLAALGYALADRLGAKPRTCTALAVPPLLFAVVSQGAPFLANAYLYPLLLFGIWMLIRNWSLYQGKRLTILVLLIVAVLDTSRNPGLRLFRLSSNIGGYWVRPWDSALVILGLILIVLLVRRLLDDRREKQRLAGELEAARAVQQLLLPGAQTDSSRWTIDAVYQPAQEVGGDFHWSRTLPDGSVLVAVGDVSGKGLKAAMLVSVVIGILRTARCASPAGILSLLNEGLAGHPGGGFVTCCCARLTPNGEAVVSNAGHLPPYSDGGELALDPALPLGISPDNAYTEAQLTWGPEWTFVSDGVPEATNARGELFGFERTRAISAKPAREIAEAARAWGQNDDITVVTVRRSA